MQFDIAVLVRQGLTYSPTSCRKRCSMSILPCASCARRIPGGTLLYDAVVKASDEIMKNAEGP